MDFYWLRCSRVPFRFLGDAKLDRQRRQFEAASREHLQLERKLPDFLGARLVERSEASYAAHKQLFWQLVQLRKLDAGTPWRLDTKLNCQFVGDKRCTVAKVKG